MVQYLESLQNVNVLHIREKTDYIQSISPARQTFWKPVKNHSSLQSSRVAKLVTPNKANGLQKEHYLCFKEVYIQRQTALRVDTYSEMIYRVSI